MNFVLVDSSENVFYCHYNERSTQNERETQFSRRKYNNFLFYTNFPQQLTLRGPLTLQYNRSFACSHNMEISNTNDSRLSGSCGLLFESIIALKCLRKTS